MRSSTPPNILHRHSQHDLSNSSLKARNKDNTKEPGQTNQQLSAACCGQRSHPDPVLKPAVDVNDHLAAHPWCTHVCNRWGVGASHHRRQLWSLLTCCCACGPRSNQRHFFVAQLGGWLRSVHFLWQKSLAIDIP